MSPQPFQVCGPLRLPVLPDASEWRRSGVVAEFPRWAVVGFTAPLSWTGLAAAAKVLFKLQNETAQVFVADELCRLSGRKPACHALLRFRPFLGLSVHCQRKDLDLAGNIQIAQSLFI